MIEIRRIMLKDNIEHHAYEARTECSYLLYVPETIDATTLVIATLHGYGSNAEDMLRLTAFAVGRRHIIASLQAPHQHYTTAPSAGAVAGYNWGIRQHWHSAIETHQRMVQQVLTELRSRFSVGPDRTVLFGFSQPVGLNYRFAGTYPGWVRGVIGICGGVPRDWEESNYQKMDVAILHISRDEDEFYPVPVVQEFGERLRKYASDVEFHLLPGGHKFPSKGATLIQPWLRRVFGS